MHAESLFYFPFETLKCSLGHPAPQNRDTGIRVAVTNVRLYQYLSCR